MKLIKYTLFPEAYSSNGTFIDKEGCVGKLIVDVGLLINSNFDKVIPKIDMLNKLLIAGGNGRAGEWEPFELNREEYMEVVEYLFKLPLNKKYRIEHSYETIRFYKVNDKYGCFSNFSKNPFILNGIVYQTAEHYFQSQKFEGTELEKEIILAKTPMEAAILGRNKKNPLRNNWEEIKNNIMYDAVLGKFKQNEEIKNILLATGDSILIEATSNDYYWGEGNLKNGKNMLGEILMKIRNELNIYN